MDTTSASQTLQRAAAVVEYPDDFPASICRYLNSESRGSGISVSRGGGSDTHQPLLGSTRYIVFSMLDT